MSCYCGRHFAVGSADSLVSLWDISEMLCVRTFTKLEWVFLGFMFMYSALVFQVICILCFLWQTWNVTILRWPVRTIGFNHTGDFIASASEDLFIDIVSYMTFYISIYILFSNPTFAKLDFIHLSNDWNSICILFGIQSNVRTGRTVHQIPCRAAMNSVEWNPKYNLLAYAGDDKNKYQADEGITFWVTMKF